MPERELDPQAAAVLETVEAVPVPPTFALSVESARERLADFFGRQTAAPVAAAEEFSLPGPADLIDVRLYLPERATPPLVVFYHGGGWVLGGPLSAKQGGGLEMPRRGISAAWSHTTRSAGRWSTPARWPSSPWTTGWRRSTPSRRGSRMPTRRWRGPRRTPAG